MDILAGWGKVEVTGSQLQRYSGHWADTGAQVGLLPESFGDLVLDEMVAKWSGVWTAFVGTAGLHSRTLHSMSILGRERNPVRLYRMSFGQIVERMFIFSTGIIHRAGSPIYAYTSSIAYLTTGHSEHLVEGYDGSSLMELHQVVQTAVTLVLPDYDELSVV